MKKTTTKRLARRGTKGHPKASRTASQRRVLSALPKTKAKNAYDLLSDVRALILAEPKRYHQGLYIAHETNRLSPKLESYPACGTVGCVAGWVATLIAPKKFGYWDASTVAQAALGIDIRQRMELFDGDAIQGKPQTLAYAKRGAAHIRAFQQRYADELKATPVTR